ncbi:MAG: hypothetical protein ACTS8S_19810 [Giesbergeria sp.]
MSTAWLPTRPGLAGGIDNDGSRAAELLAAGFGSVEFGTVTPRPEPGANPGVVALATRLRALPPRAQGAARVGVGIGMGGGAAPETLAAEWCYGYQAAWEVADYLSFNLSARRYQALLTPAHWPLLLQALGAVTNERQRQVAAGGRHLPLALKLPLGPAGGFPLALAQAAAAAGFDAVTAVLPVSSERLDRLRLLSAQLQGQAAIVAVGGIRSAGDVRAALAAGANAVQVHSVFAQRGDACLPDLLNLDLQA